MAESARASRWLRERRRARCGRPAGFGAELSTCPAYDPVASSTPAEFGISTSISSVETFSPRSMLT